MIRWEAGVPTVILPVSDQLFLPMARLQTSQWCPRSTMMSWWILVRKKALFLPSHHPYDWPIDVVAGALLRIYNLSHPRLALEEWWHLLYL